MNVLLIACYELGHQPLSLAWPAAVLRRAGHQVVTMDLSVESLSDDPVHAADLIAVSVPMHTAMRLGIRAAEAIRRAKPNACICFFGLYAWLNAEYLLDSGHADFVIAGEAEEPLLALVEQVKTTAAGNGHLQELSPIGVSSRARRDRPYLTRTMMPVPDRAGLPPLSQYAHYVANGRRHLAGYIEASRGCLHTCRHCPVVPVYRGRFFVTPLETVMADIRQQVDAGAEHITFGDPDFLNGPGHVRRIAQALHAEFTSLTFDFTTKVEHILQHRSLIAELRENGATFVISAFESVNDDILARLLKGHTRADMEEALAILADAGLAVQPTWLPFTPWTTLDDYLDLLHWIREHNLIANVPAVQLAIRLLVPPGSALLDDPETATWLGPLDAANFVYDWRNPDPRVDALQLQVTAVAEKIDDPYEGFEQIEHLAYAAARRSPPPTPVIIRLTAPPRLTEDWFCCAEPTTLQVDRLVATETTLCCQDASCTDSR